MLALRLQLDDGDVSGDDGGSYQVYRERRLKKCVDRSCAFIEAQPSHS